MMTERGQDHSSPRNDVLYFLGEPHRMAMLTDPERSRPFLTRALKSFRRYTPDQLAELTGILLSGMGTHDNIWTEQRKNAALQLFKVVPFDSEKMSADVLLNQFVEVLGKQDESTYPESISSLLDAGVVLAPHLPLTGDSKNALYMETLDNTIEKLKNQPGNIIVEKKAEEIKKRLKGVKRKHNVSEKTENPAAVVIAKARSDKDIARTLKPHRSIGSDAQDRKRKATNEERKADFIALVLSEEGRDKLSKTDFAVLEMYYRDGMSHKEIGEMLGLNPFYVSRIRQKALEIKGIPGKSNIDVDFTKK